MKYIAIITIRLYQMIISPFLSVAAGSFAGCRFEVSCSEYTINEIRNKGVRAGVVRGIVRIAHCHPFARHHTTSPQ